MPKLNIDQVLDEMRATDVPVGESGLWRVFKILEEVVRWEHGQLISPGHYTFLSRYTDATLLSGGTTVMSDDLRELRRHLQFVLAARGTVLVTGLGLGCVLRGLLLNPRVEHVDVVERSADVLSLVAPHLPDDRFLIHHAEAVSWVKAGSGSWDFAWHDLWSDRDRGEEALPIIHQRLMLALRGRVRWQGAWAYPRYLRRVLREHFPSTRAWWPTKEIDRV